MLLHSGVPILDALEIARGSAGNREFSHRLGDTAARVREGQDLSEPLAATRLFPATVISTIAVGQDGGRLGEVLIEIGRRADEDIDHALRVFLSVLEPALIAMMAGVVFFIVLATLLPIFSLNSMMK